MNKQNGICAFIFRPRRRRGNKLVKGKHWVMRYRLPGELSYTAESLGVTDEQVARSKMMAFVREKEREAAGIIEPKLRRDAAVKAMRDHLSDFVTELGRRGRATMYVYNLEKRLTRLLAECGWSLLRDVTVDSFEAWRSIQPVDVSVKTLNDYLDGATCFMNWLNRRGRLLGNPLAGVEKIKAGKRERAIKRALSDSEVQALLAVAGSCKAVYLTAVLTGLRRGELKSLRWGDAHLDALRPFLAVRASTTKNGKSARILLRDDLVTELRRVRPENAGGSVPVFGKAVPSMEEFRLHLAAAGIAAVDSEGRRVVFHSLRKTFNTCLQRGGVPERTIMEMMRVSDRRLIDQTYMDAGLLQTADALDRIARFADRSTPVVLGTGTGLVVSADAQGDAQTLVKSCPAVSIVDVGSRGEHLSQAAADGETCGDLSRFVASGAGDGNHWGSRIRT